jgi:alanine racemase
VQNFVVHIPEGCADKANFLIVENTLDALQQFAAYYRSRFHFPVIGLNGNTIVRNGSTSC